MTQTELEIAVAHRTGESLREIKRRGFSLADPTPAEDTNESWRPPLRIDWDAHDESIQRLAGLSRSQRRRAR